MQVSAEPFTGERKLRIDLAIFAKVSRISDCEDAVYAFEATD